MHFGLQRAVRSIEHSGVEAEPRLQPEQLEVVAREVEHGALAEIAGNRAERRAASHNKAARRYAKVIGNLKR